MSLAASVLGVAAIACGTSAEPTEEPVVQTSEEALSKAEERSRAAYGAQGASVAEAALELSSAAGRYAWESGDGGRVLEAIERLEAMAPRSGDRECDVWMALAALHARSRSDLHRAAEAARRGLGAGGDRACRERAQSMVDMIQAATEQTNRATLTSVEVERNVLHGQVEATLKLTWDQLAPFDRETAEAGRGLDLRFPAARVADGVAMSGSLDAGAARYELTRRSDGLRLQVMSEVPISAQVTIVPSPFQLVVSVRPDLGGSGDQRVQTIVLDPGHGGDDRGAENEELHEADIALDLSNRVASRLNTLLPGVRVLRTRHDDTFISLPQRTAFANTARADLFVSLHLNSANEYVAYGGVTTFVLNTSGDEAALKLAARENGRSQHRVSSMQQLMASVLQRDQAGASRALAESVQSHMVQGGRRLNPRLRDRGVKDALFYVLVGARMPAVLVETSFLTNWREAQMLKRDDYRQAIADGIADGIAAYARAR